MKYLLSLRNRNTGGPVVPGRLVGGAGLGRPEDLQIEAKVTLLLHGFNVALAVGRAGLLRLAALLPSAEGIIAVLWPGDHWLGPLSYSFEGRDADDSAFELARFLDDRLRPDAAISMVGHSLGCRVVMESAKRLNALGREVAQVCLMAPAIDDDSLSAPDEYQHETSRLTGLAAMSSLEDRVLKFAYPAGDLLQAFLFWQESGDFALGYHGPRKHRRSGTGIPPNLLDLRIPAEKKVGHSDYVPDGPANAHQQAAAAFADAFLDGASEPQYR
jgi:Alpha/beta hydrolase of unknown function (DUF900)